MDNKQLYEKQSNQYNPFFPIVRLEDIIDKITEKSIQWILNNYNHIYVEYSESRKVTRNKVPQMLRRSGLWISYNNGKKNITEYYLGENTNINNYLEWTSDDNWKEFDELIIQDKTITYQHLSDALRELVAGGNTITNFPDEEDITTDGTVLSFKDRNYEPNNFSGLGRVILRKNVNIDKDGNAKNILTQGMIDKENTIYEIRYDFDLNDGEITIPEDCVLDFQGGSFSNGVLIGNDTSIKTTIDKIFDISIKIEGTWNINECYPEWFGAIGDGITDDTKAINSTLAAFTTTKLLRKTYLVNTIDSEGVALKLPYGHNIIGQDSKRHIVGGSDITIKTTNDKCIKILELNGSNTVKNIVIQGCNSRSVNPVLEHCGIGGPNGYITKLLIEQVQVANCEVGYNLQCYLSSFVNTDSSNCGIGFYLHGSLNENMIPRVKTTTIFMENCQAISCRKHGFYFVGVDYSTFINLAADGSGRAWDGITNANSYYPYNFEHCVRCTFTSLGAETVYKTIRTSVCHNLIFDGIYSIIGYSSNESENHADEAPTRLIYNHYSYNLHYKNVVIQTNGTIQNLIQDSSDCVALVVEGSASDKIAVTIDGVPVGTDSENLVRAGNITTSGFITEDNIVINYTLHKSNYAPDSTIAITDYLRDTVKVKYNEAKDINIVLKSTAFWGGPDNRIVDLRGKHLSVVKSDEDGWIQIKQNGGDRTWGFSNGKVTFKHIQMVVDSGTSAYITNLMLSNCEVEFIDCIIYVEKGTMSSEYKYLIETNSTVYFRNCRFILNDMPLINHSYVNSVSDSFPIYSNPYGTIKGTKLTLDGITYIAQSDGVAMFSNIEKNVNALPVYPSAISEYFDGCCFYNNGVYKIYKKGKWYDNYGLISGTPTFGTFANKPTTYANNIPIGFAYFCTDKQTAEGESNGTMIYHKDNNVWVDALGRVVE